MHLAALYLKTKCNILLTEMSSGTCSIKCQPRCLNLNVAKVSQSQRTCEAVSDACLRLSNSGIFASPSLNRCNVKRQYPASRPVIILGWFMFILSNFPAFLAESFLRKPSACLCPHMDCHCSSCFLFIQSLITPLTTFKHIPSGGSGPVCG